PRGISAWVLPRCSVAERTRSPAGAACKSMVPRETRRVAPASGRTGRGGPVPSCQYTCRDYLGFAREDDEAHLPLDVLDLGFRHGPGALSSLLQDAIQLGPVGHQGLVALPDRPQGLNDDLGHLPLEGSVPLPRKVFDDGRATLLRQQLVDLQEVV